MPRERDRERGRVHLEGHLVLHVRYVAVRHLWSISKLVRETHRVSVELRCVSWWRQSTSGLCLSAPEEVDHSEWESEEKGE